MRTRRPRAEFDDFVAHSSEQLLRTAYLITWDLAEAEDLVQECLLRLARRWPRARRMNHPEAYARRILVNLALDGARMRGQRRAELGGTGDSALERLDSRSPQPVAALEDRGELIAAIGALPNRQRLMLVLRYFADLSEEQTAHALDCSLGTVKSTTSRALARLREAMDASPASHRATANPPARSAMHPSSTMPPSTSKEAAHDPAT